MFGLICEAISSENVATLIIGIVNDYWYIYWRYSTSPSPLPCGTPDVMVFKEEYNFA